MVLIATLGRTRHAELAMSILTHQRVIPDVDPRGMSHRRVVARLTGRG
jgi:hypothetical protein